MIRVITAGAHARVVESNLKQVNLKRNISLVDVTNPSLSEVNQLHERFKISIADINACLDNYESPRIKQTKEYTLIIYSQSHCEEDLKRCGPIGFFFTRRHLIAIHLSKLPFIDELDLNADMTKHMFHNGTEIILLRILYNLIKSKHKLLEVIEDSLESIEDDVLSAAHEHIVKRIFALKNKLLYLKKSVSGNRSVINDLIKDVPAIKEKALFAELNVETMQVSDTLEIYRERLTSILEINTGNISNKINVVMKYFTVIASVLLLPMLITGLYGMNVVLPFQEHQQAFWIVFGIIIACIVVMLLVFNNKKWL